MYSSTHNTHAKEKKAKKERTSSGPNSKPTELLEHHHHHHHHHRLAILRKMAMEHAYFLFCHLFFAFGIRHFDLLHCYDFLFPVECRHHHTTCHPIIMFRSLCFILLLLTSCFTSLAFLSPEPSSSSSSSSSSSPPIVRRHHHRHHYHRHHHYHYHEDLIIVSMTRSSGDDDHEDRPIGNSKCNKALQQELTGRAETFKVEKLRESLEHQNTQSFLKRKPFKLPYEQARKWVQYNLGVDTQAEFDDLVANGNVRTPYIPKRPEEYYTHTRDWISWDHFLTGYHNNQNPSAIRPSDGIFD